MLQRSMEVEVANGRRSGDAAAVAGKIVRLFCRKFIDASVLFRKLAVNYQLYDFSGIKEKYIPGNRKN